MSEGTGAVSHQQTCWEAPVCAPGLLLPADKEHLYHEEAQE